jgi:hypothetical protein
MSDCSGTTSAGETELAMARADERRLATQMGIDVMLAEFSATGLQNARDRSVDIDVYDADAAPAPPADCRRFAFGLGAHILQMPVEDQAAMCVARIKAHLRAVGARRAVAEVRFGAGHCYLSMYVVGADGEGESDDENEGESESESDDESESGDDDDTERASSPLPDEKRRKI